MASHGYKERKDFPILCETCLGDNPYVRMIRATNDKECKVCAIPFTVYKWKAGTDGRLKKTEICTTCSKMKHICQTCLLDIDTGVPVQFRDSILSVPATEAGNALSVRPQSNVMREYQASLNEKRVAQGLIPDYTLANNAVQMVLSHKEPYYKRNRSKVCSFWLKNACNRGATCPFRHEKPDHQSPELASQNIKDRYYGKNDPVANKMMKKLKEQEKNYEAPPDITTLWINGVLPDRITKSDLHDHFYPFGEIVSIKIAESKNCAFVEYSQHQEALKAIEHLRNDLVIKGQFLRVNWAKPLSQNPDSAAGLEAEDQCNAQPVPIIPPPPGYYGTLPPMMVVSDKFVPLGGENGPHVPPVSAWPVSYYPSMNPNRMGSIPSHRAKAAQTPPAPENPSEATPKGSPAQRPDPLGDGEEARPSGS